MVVVVVEGSKIVEEEVNKIKGEEEGNLWRRRRRT